MYRSQSLTPSAIREATRLVDEVWRGTAAWKTNYRRARTLLTSAVRADPDNPTLLTCLGTVLSDMGSHRQAIALLEKAVKLGATDRHTFFNLAVATLNTGAHARAMRLFAKAGTLKPRSGTWEAYFDPQAH